MGYLQDRLVHDHVDRSRLCPGRRSVRTPAGAGDGGSTLLRPATPGRRRFGDHQLPGGGAKSAPLACNRGTLPESASSVSDPSDTDRVEPWRVVPERWVGHAGLSVGYGRRMTNACREPPLFATSMALPAGVWIRLSPVTSRGARKPLSTGATEVKWPRPSPLSQSPLPASAAGVFGSAPYRFPATIKSTFPSRSTSWAMIPRIGEICAALGSCAAVNVPLPLFCKYRLANVSVWSWSARAIWDGLRTAGMDA